MRFKINLNGDSSATIANQQMAVYKAANELIEALRQTMPHGRNYQTCEDGAYDSDRRDLLEAIESVTAVADAAIIGSKRVRKQEKGDYTDS